MNFLPTVNNIVPAWMHFILLGMMGLAVLSLLVIFVSKFFKNSLGWLLEPLGIGLVFLMTIWLMIMSGVYVINAPARADNLQSNLLQKYDIISVDYESEIAPLELGESESQLIAVNLKDGKTGNFLLTQDSRTNEPTLSELPESAVRVEEITR